MSAWASRIFVLLWKRSKALNSLLGVTMKNLFLVASVASIMASVPVISAAQGTSIPAPAFAAECGYSADATIFGVGMAAGTHATPVLLPIERKIEEKGDKPATLRLFPLAAKHTN